MEPDDASSAEMRRGLPDPPPLDEETVERLLAGDLPPAVAPPGYAEVAAVLEAAVAPPAPEELAGGQAVLAELRAVTRARAAATATRPVASSRRRRRVGLAAVAVVGALVTGGAAGAATGHLPASMRDAARTIVDAVGGGEPSTPTHAGAPPPSATPSSASGGVGRAGQGAVSTGRGAGLAGRGSVAGSDLKGLCRAYLAGKGGEQGKKLDAAAFQALAAAAGGADRIDAWCQEAITDRPGNPQKPPEEKQPGGPPTSSGQGNGGGNGPPPSSNGADPEQGPPVTQPSRG
jgi:hypothetical protein